MTELEMSDAQVIQELRHKPEYETIVSDNAMSHPFHRRYHAKPRISQASSADAHLVRFRLGNKDAEILERQKDGLTFKIILMVSGKPWVEMRSHLEAETIVADYLGEV